MESKSNFRSSVTKITLLGMVVALGISFAPSSAQASEAPLILGSASTYGVLASSTVTSAAASTVTGTAGGDVGVGGGTAPTGDLTASGTRVLGGSSIAALTAASGALASNRGGTATPVELGAGRTILPGAYSGGTLGVTGTLTLDGAGDANSVFIFRAASTLVTAVASKVLLTNGAQACNVFWQIGSSATLGGSSTIVGHVIAQASISIGTSSSVDGQLIAISGAVTLGGTTLVNNACTAVSVAPVAVASSVATPTPSTTSVGTTTEPAVSPVAPGTPTTLHVVKVVVNTHGGTAYPSAFLLHVTRNGKDVLTSPAFGVSDPGTSYTLAPGQYVVYESPMKGYRGMWSGPISSGGTITLAAGQEATITRTNYDIGTMEVMSPTTTPAPTPAAPSPSPTKSTVNGGVLPKTATPYGNALIFGAGLLLLGGAGLFYRRSLSK